MLQDSGTLTFKLPKQDVVHTDAPASTTVTAPVNAPVPPSNNANVEDQIINEILNNVPQRSLKNIKFILNKISNAKQLCSWTDSGEFVFKGHVIDGSHMLDLVKNITAPHTIRNEYRPSRWSEFLDDFAILNIPFSTISNPQIKRTVETLKRRSPSHKMTTPLKKRRGKRVMAASQLSTPNGNVIYPLLRLVHG